MTPKEKARDLIGKFVHLTRQTSGANGTIYNSQQCALIAVDEIFEFMKMDDEYTETVSNANSKWVDYWLEVKQEIEKL
jgi:hypothetical protein